MKKTTKVKKSIKLRKAKNKHNRIPRFLQAIILGIIISLLIIFTPKLQSIFSPEENPQVTPAPSVQASYLPERIAIPSLNLYMPIKAATVSANTWQIHEDAVSWLNTSGNLQSGNIVLYAHNYPDAFGKIVQMGIGSSITVANSERSQEYQVTEVFAGSPQDIKYLQKQENILTMYTCSGWFDKNRFFVIAKPI